MCARYVFFNGRVVQDDFGAVPLPDLQPRFNICPTQVVPAVIEREGKRQATLFQWGLVPHWAKDPSIGQKLVNARGETLAEKPSFRGAYKYRRCIIPADGFYEWMGQKGAKRPFYIHRADGKTMAFAGLWEEWETPEAHLTTCTIVTTEANADVAPLHERMPVVLEGTDIDTWLDPDIQETKVLQPLLVPLPDGVLTKHEVGKAVSSPRSEGPELLVPVGSASLFD